MASLSNNRTKIMIQVTTTEDFKVIDQIINLETQRKISRVAGSEYYGIMTACYINGEFVLVSEYDICKEIADKLKKA